MLSFQPSSNSSFHGRIVGAMKFLVFRLSLLGWDLVSHAQLGPAHGPAACPCVLSRCGDRRLDDHDMNELVCAIDSPHGAFQHGGKVRELIATAIEFRKVWAKSAHEQFDLVFECL